MGLMFDDFPASIYGGISHLNREIDRSLVINTYFRYHHRGEIIANPPRTDFEVRH
jgi:hypothetical protein